MKVVTSALMTINMLYSYMRRFRLDIILTPLLNQVYELTTTTQLILVVLLGIFIFLGIVIYVLTAILRNLENLQ